MDSIRLSTFKQTIWNHYALHGRLFGWRNEDDPYKVFISEVMLQQTQTSRVIQKYKQWIAVFPDFESLAQASLKDVLLQWQGLGYNRRGIYLHRAAQIIVNKYSGILPGNPEILIELPGIGKATACSIVAFSFNKPTIFIETNIRAVYIHFFFNGQENIHDKQIEPLVQATIDLENPREWYYALMDYGVLLKKNLINPSRKSKHYHRQSKFEGSDRQIRGAILRMLLQSKKPIAQNELISAIGKDILRVKKIIEQLEAEQFILVQDHFLTIV